MPRRIARLFDPDAPVLGGGLLSLVISDYLAFYCPTPMRRRWEVATTNRTHSTANLAFLFVPRLLVNPCLHASVLIRIALNGPRILHGLWRTILIAKHSIDILPNIEIGPGLVLPHPIGLCLGWGLRIGTNVTLLHNVSIGQAVPRPPGDTKLSPTLEDDVVIFGDAWILGPVTLGRGTVVGAGGYVDQDTPPDSVWPGRAAVFRALRESKARARKAEPTDQAAGAD